MPSYEYRCKRCDETFVKMMSFARHERAHLPPCPKCRSRKVEQAPSSFQAVTSKKS